MSLKKNKPRKRTIVQVRLVNKACEKVTTNEPPYFVCARCRKIISVGFHYTESNIGDIVLCQQCDSLCKRDFKYKDMKDMDEIDRSLLERKTHIDFTSPDTSYVVLKLEEQYEGLMSAINLAYAHKRIGYLYKRFESNINKFLKYCNAHATALAISEDLITRLIRKSEDKYKQYKKKENSLPTKVMKRRNIIAVSDPKLRVNFAYKVLQMLRDAFDQLVPDVIINRLTVRWDTLTFNTNAVKVNGSNQTLHCSLRGAKSFYNHFITIFSNLIPEIQIELHSRRAPQVMNIEEFHEVFKYLDIKEEMVNGNIDAYRMMFEHIRGAKINLNKAIIPEDKTIYINYLLQRHNNNFKYIPVYEKSLSDCDAFLFTVTKNNICYIVWENVSPNTATYIFACDIEKYEYTLQKVYDYISSDIAYKRMMLYRREIDSKIGLEYRTILHNSFSQWKNDISAYIDR